MRTNRKFLLLAALSVVVAGCGQNEPPAAPAATSVGTQIDDTVVTSRVKAALLADPDIRSFDLKVETRKGEVQLSGFVDSQAQIERALAAARLVEGVKTVANAMNLKERSATLGQSLDDGIITTKVKSALLADPGMKSLDVAVVTRAGAVQLSGFVDSQVQIDQALALVRKVEGVSRVENEMSIKK
jgi:hyperosmotically inducible protein